MKKFTKFFENRPEDFRGHRFEVDTRTLTVPDATPTLKEIILSGAQALVGTPMYDDSPEAGLQRLIVQNAPLEMILNAQLGDFPEDEERATRTTEGGVQAEESGAAAPAAPQTVQNAE